VRKATENCEVNQNSLVTLRSAAIWQQWESESRKSDTAAGCNNT